MTIIADLSARYYADLRTDLVRRDDAHFVVGYTTTAAGSVEARIYPSDPTGGLDSDDWRDPARIVALPSPDPDAAESQAAIDAALAALSAPAPAPEVVA